MWGNTYKDNEDGVSTAIAFSAIGKETLQNSDLELKQYPFEIVAEGQMKAVAPYHKWYKAIIYSLRIDWTSIDEILIIRSALQKIIRKVNRIKNKIDSLRNK